MLRSNALPLLASLLGAVGCSGADARAGDAPDAAAQPADASDAGDSTDAPADGARDGAAIDADPDADASASGACAVFGAPGTCMTVPACAALADHSSYAGHCPGASSVECCIQTPNVADNPPIPAGYKLMAQSQVTSEMTTWAVSILHDPVTYPMFSTATKVFGAQTVLARVEWHPPDFLNSAVHRGVTLYVPV